MNKTLAALLPLAIFMSGCGDAAAGRRTSDGMPVSQVRTPVAHVVSAAATAGATPPRVELPPPPPPPAITEGDRSLYRSHCAACHGDEGRGNGPLAALADPPPRDFAHGAFKLRSTKSGLPRDTDLLAVISNGMPGSGMPSFAGLGRDDAATLVRVVRRLAFEGKVADLLADDAELGEAEAQDIAATLQTPGPAFEVPARPDTPPQATPERTFSFYCTECHGADGTGADAVVEDLKDYAGRPTRARDLTREALKGGATHEDVIRRIYLGMPGTPMPETTALPENLWALADHVMLLRGTAPVPVPVDARVTIAPDASGLADAEPASLPLFPLRPDGQDATAVSVSVSRAEDGLTVRATWEPVDASAAAWVLVRVSSGPGEAFAWNGADTEAAWESSAAPAGAVPAVIRDQRFVADTVLDVAAASGGCIAVTICERGADGTPGRVAFTNWHALDAGE